jgi:hypothetical protein
VRLLSYALADALGPHGIRVNNVAPGIMATMMNVEDDPVIGTAQGESYLPMIPARRWGTPGIAAVAGVYLASDMASYVTGITHVVDGGYLRIRDPDDCPAACVAAVVLSRPARGLGPGRSDAGPAVCGAWRAAGGAARHPPGCPRDGARAGSGCCRGCGLRAGFAWWVDDGGCCTGFGIASVSRRFLVGARTGADGRCAAEQFRVAEHVAVECAGGGARSDGPAGAVVSWRPRGPRP